MKKYIAKTNVSVNIVLSTGANMHVSFTPLTGGSSVYYTDEPEIQKALERHYKYGKLFKEDTSQAAEAMKAKAGMKAAAPTPAEGTGEVEDAAAEPGEGEGNELKTVSVSDPDDAKAYLAEHFGVSRTKLKSLKAIKEAAESYGIVFEGI